MGNANLTDDQDLDFTSLTTQSFEPFTTFERESALGPLESLTPDFDAFASMDDNILSEIFDDSEKVESPFQFLCSPTNVMGGQLEMPSLGTIPPSPEPFAIPLNASPYLPSTARFLLWHYATTTIPSLSGVPMAKGERPWDEFHLPCGLRAYAELNVLGNSDLARVSHLYSILSIACFQLDRLHEADPSSGLSQVSSFGMADGTYPWRTGSKWRDQGAKFKNIARTGFHRCLESLKTGGKKSVQYEEVLLAAMSLICVGIISGDTLDSHIYILHFEDCVRKLGAANHKFSERTKNLHRMFRFLQVFEAMSFCRSPQEYTRALKNRPCSEVDLALVAPTAQPDEHEVTSLQLAPRLTAQDLDIDGPEDEFHEDYYGAKGSLLTLLSQTTQMVNEIETGFPQSATSPLPPELAQRLTELENRICQWSRKRPGPNDPNMYLVETEVTQNIVGTGDDNSDLGGGYNIPAAMQDCMTTTVHHALLIYFYRRVRQTNPVILQHYAESVVTNLEAHATFKTIYAPLRLNTIVWPAFIAACESLSDTLRSRAFACMQQAGWAGFRNHEAAEGVVREVWRRSDAQLPRSSWWEVIKDMDVNVVLT